MPIETSIVVEQGQELGYKKLTREERERLYGPWKPFSLEDWLATAPPPTREELEEMEELLRLREKDREDDIARQMGLQS